MFWKKRTHKAIFELYDSEDNVLGRVFFECTKHAYDGEITYDISDPHVLEMLKVGVEQTTVWCGYTGVQLTPWDGVWAFPALEQHVECLTRMTSLGVARVELIQPLDPKLFPSEEKVLKLLGFDC